MSIKRMLLALMCFAVYVTAFAQVQQGVDIDGEAVSDESGYRVDISADGYTVAIGAPYNSGYAGHVRVYEWNGAAWQQKGADIDGEAVGDYSAWSLAMSSDGNAVAVGAPYNNGKGVDMGHVRIYEWDGTSWMQKGADIDGEAFNNKSGWSVALSADGNTVAIGIPYSGFPVNCGVVRIFTWDGTAWIQKGVNIQGEANYNYSGFAISLSNDGQALAIGAPENGTGPFQDRGHVRVYQWDSTAWVQKGADLDGEAANDRSGQSVSLNANGNVVAIGAPLNDGNGVNAGQVRVYAWNGTAWVQKGVDLDGDASADWSGTAVDITAGGDTVVIGAPYNNGNGTKSGKVKIFTWDGLTWIKTGADIIGEAAGDQSGFDLAVNADGSKLAIGAPFNNGSGASSGHVRVFDLSGINGMAGHAHIGKLNLYPNPASNHIHIVCGNQSSDQNAVIQIYSLTGMLAKSLPVTTEIIYADISNLNNGIYILKLQTQSVVLQQKLEVIK